MDAYACEAYARKWARKEDVELDTLSEWIKSIGEVVKRRIRRLKHSVNTRSESIFRDIDVVRELSRLHENFVIVPADKASNNYTFVCKRHYVDILIENLHSIHFLKPYIQSDSFFCIRGVGQQEIDPHLLWNTVK